MSLRSVAIAAGLTTLLGTGAAFAQSSPNYPPPGSQQAPYAHHQHRHHHGVIALIREEMTAGRISRKEGTLLEHKIREMHAEHRAERQAREQSMQGPGGYGPRSSSGQGEYPPPSQQPNPQ